MNVEKLSALVDDLLEDYEETKIVSLLQKLMKYLQNQIHSAGDLSFQKGVVETLSSIRENLENAPSNNFPKDWENMIDDFKIREHYGKHLLAKINNIFSENEITPMISLARIQMIYKDVDNLQSNLNNMQNSFEYLDIDKDYLEEGECEISIIFPSSYAKLDKLSKELGRLNKDTRPFVEVTGERSDGFIIRNISSSDPTFYLLATPAVAYSIMKFVHFALQIYHEILEIKETKKRLENHELEKSLLTSIDDAIEKKIKTLSKKYIEKNLEEMQSLGDTKHPSGRTPNELQNQLSGSIEKLVKRLDEGFSINVRGERYKPKENRNEEGKVELQELPDDKKLKNRLIQKIQDSRELLTYRNTEEPQITGLLNHIEDGSAEENGSEDGSAEENSSEEENK